MDHRFDVHPPNGVGYRWHQYSFLVNQPLYSGPGKGDRVEGQVRVSEMPIDGVRRLRHQKEGGTHLKRQAVGA